jgi:hypothetical protein
MLVSGETITSRDQPLQPIGGFALGTPEGNL